jgi:4'-phosphopantetheinyl transferase
VLTPTELDDHKWVALWTPRPPSTDGLVEGLARSLTDDEVARFDRTPTTHGGASFVMGRALLRAALAAATSLEPGTIHLDAAEDGKLSLRAVAGTPEVHFNLSHSPSHLLAAFSRHPHVGVDIEDVRPFSPRLPERFFLPDEVARLKALPEEEQPAAFFHLWVIKEACIKAHGRTLGPAIASVPASLDAAGSHGELGWEILDLAPEVKAAIAIEAPGDAAPGIVRRITLADLA